MSDGKRIGRGAEEAAVAAWIERLGSQVTGAGWSPRAGGMVDLEHGDGLPPPDAGAGPAASILQPRPDPRAHAFFREAEEAARRLRAPKNDRYRDLYDVVRRTSLRYLLFTRQKLASMFQAMKPRERDAFIAIPFLLHVNIPNLPGYVDAGPEAAPHGISSFEFNEAMQSVVERLFGAGTVKSVPGMRRPAIRSLLCMGSVGTIGQTGKSDVDYWVVVDERELGPAVSRLLLKKIEAIEAWAQSRGLDAHFFVVDTERAQRDDFGGIGGDNESSGSAQGRLLKEEFYRTAVYVAGRLPLWWVTPVGVTADEYRRLRRVVEERLEQPELAFVDLGYIGAIDRGEFFGAALWHINKSLRDPFKSLLKMALLARYMDDEHPRLLADVLKKRVFEGARAPQYTDPYVLLFDAISEYFAARGDWSAFRLVQKCFYLKVGLQLSRETADKTRFMERFEVMRAYIIRWGWSEDLLRDLDDIDRWSAERVDALGRAIQDFMLGIFRHLVDRARAETVRINEDDVAVLGRRLYACFAEEPGKIRHLFTYFLREPRIEERLVVLEVPSAPPHRRWEVHRRLEPGQTVSRADAIWAGADLAEVAAWLTFNGLFAHHTMVGLIGGADQTTLGDFRRMLERFQSLFACPDPFNISPAEFLDRRRVRRAAVVLNFDAEGARAEARESAGVFYLPENWDVLNYGRQRASRVRDVSVVTLDSWGEVFCTRHTGAAALHEALRALGRRLRPGRPLEDEIEILVPRGRSTQALRNRIGALVEQILRICVEPVPDGRSRAFVNEAGGIFQTFLRRGDRVRVVTADRIERALRPLGCLGAEPLEIFIDPLSPTLRGVGTLVERHASDREAEIYVGWLTEGERTYIFVRDELGRLHARSVPERHAQRVLARTVLRTVYHLRGRAQNAAELRRRLRVYEIRRGRSAGESVQMVDDAARVLSRAIELQRSRGTGLWLRGDLTQGRRGVALTLGSEEFGPRTAGRDFALHLVRRLLRDHSIYETEPFQIDASAVRFGPAYEGADGEGDRGLVKHLRLMALYEQLIRRALRAYQGGGRRRARVAAGGLRRAVASEEP